MGGFEKPCDVCQHHQDIVEGVTGTFRVEACEVWNAKTASWEAVLRIVSFEEDQGGGLAIGSDLSSQFHFLYHHKYKKTQSFCISSAFGIKKDNCFFILYIFKRKERSYEKVL